MNLGVWFVLISIFFMFKIVLYDFIVFILFWGFF